MKKFFKILLILVLVLVLALAGLIGWLSATEYQPAPVETLAPLSDAATAGLPQGETLELLSWNIGYAGLGKGSDFVLDGGENMRAAEAFGMFLRSLLNVFGRRGKKTSVLYESHCGIKQQAYRHGKYK